MKYFTSETWKKYLLEHIEIAKKFLESIPDNLNKGIQFEVLVECLLLYMFQNSNIYFNSTKASHDGNKDFWALDETNELWWAECKNYSPNISLTQLAPTLVMAELNSVHHLLFFSYSKLNLNLKKKLAQYSNIHQKEIFLFDDESLEDLIFSYAKNMLNKNCVIKDFKTNEDLEIIYFNEVDSNIIDKRNFNGYYEIEELKIGEIYNLNAIIINKRIDKEFSGIVSVMDGPDNVYFEFLSEKNYKVFETKKQNFFLKNNQIVLKQFLVRIKKYKEKLQLPRLNVSYKQDKEYVQKPSEYMATLNCSWNRKTVLIGSQYENILNSFSELCTNRSSSCGLLVYGTGGTGKTRLLTECTAILVKNRYNVLNFIGFDRNSSWKDVIREIAFQIFAIDEDTQLNIILNQNDIVAPYIKDPVKQKIIEFIQCLNSPEFGQKDLEVYYKIIFGKLQQRKQAIIVDNLQSYSPEITSFFIEMIQYFSTHKIKSNLALLFSINTTLIYDKIFFDFIGDFENYGNSFGNANLHSFSISGFNKESQAIAYLKTILFLDDYPFNYYYLKKILSKTSLKPKYIELVANWVIQEECIVIQNGKGIITDPERFKKFLDEVPPSFEGIFISSFLSLLDHYPNLKKDIEISISFIYFLNVIDNRDISALNINKEVILILLRHGVIISKGDRQNPQYMFEHDLIEMALTDKVYPNLLETAVKEIISHSDSYNGLLKDRYGQYIICKLFNSHISKQELFEIWKKKQQINLPNKFLYKFYSSFLDNIINISKEIEVEKFVSNMLECCIYVRDHISEVQSEKLFDRAFVHLKNMKLNTKEHIRLYYSFIIHFCENKMRLMKINENLPIYIKCYDKLERLQEEFLHLHRELLYAKAYIDNRIFVCGKVEGEPGKYFKHWIRSVRLSKENNFYDILFEDYFDAANLYLKDRKYIVKVKRLLKRGFYYYFQTNNVCQIKFSVNYFSKQILYLILNKEYKNALNEAENAINLLKTNDQINYHIFFTQRYKKYEIICLMLLEDYSDKLDQIMIEYERLLTITGNLENNFEWLFLQAKFAFFINNFSYFHELYKKCYTHLYTIKRDSRTIEKELVMLEDLTVKFRGQRIQFQSIKKRASGFEHINKILTMSDAEFNDFMIMYKTNAPIFSSDEQDGYFP